MRMHSHIKGRFHPVKDSELERYLCGDLDAEEQARLEALIAARPDLQQHVAQRRAEKDAFEWKRPPLRVPERSQAPGTRLRLWLFAAMATAAAALALFVTLPRGEHQPDVGIAARGGVSISVSVRRGDSVFEYRDGVLLAAGDRIRLTLSSPSPLYATVIGRLAPERWVVHYDNVPLTAGATTLPDSLELDASSGPEELFVFVSKQPVSSGRRLERVRAGARDAELTILRLEKEPRP